MAVLTTMKMVWSVKTSDLKMKLHTLSKHAKTMKIDLLKWKPKYRLVKKQLENYLTLFESENERQKIEPVPIPLPRASRNFPDVKTRNIFFS